MQVELREGAIRYRMLETVREYAREKLEASGEGAAIRDRHRDWHLQLAEQFAATVDRPEYVPRLVRLEHELDNLRAALAWCRETAAAGSESAARRFSSSASRRVNHGACSGLSVVAANCSASWRYQSRCRSRTALAAPEASSFSRAYSRTVSSIR